MLLEVGAVVVDHVQVLSDEVIVNGYFIVEGLDDFVVPVFLAELELLGESLDSSLLTVVVQILQDVIEICEGTYNIADVEVGHHI